MKERKLESTPARIAREGFTLVELLLVIAILGTLAAVVVPNLAGHSEKAKIETTRSSIKGIMTAIGTYEVSMGHFPESLDDLTRGSDSMPAPLKKEGLADSWGNPFDYKKTGKFTYKITSPGPDGQLGTEDDIWDEN